MATHSLWFDSSQLNSANSSSMYFEGEQFVESLDGIWAPRAFFSVPPSLPSPLGKTISDSCVQGSLQPN